MGVPLEYDAMSVLGTARATSNIGTLGFQELAIGYHRGITTGNWEHAQDAGFQALALNTYAGAHGNLRNAFIGEGDTVTAFRGFGAKDPALRTTIIWCCFTWRKSAYYSTGATLVTGKPRECCKSSESNCGETCG